MHRPFGRRRSRVAAALGAVAVGGALLVAMPARSVAPELARVWSVGVGEVHHSAPATGDLDGDGTLDVVFGDLAGRVHAVRAATGQSLPGWPRTVPAAVEATPTVADLDGNGRPEVVVGYGSTLVRNQHGGLDVLEHDGRLRWRLDRTLDTFNVWTAGPADGYREGVFSTPAVGDVDGDGRLDIVFGAWDNRIYALDRDGVDVPGFPFHHDDSVWGSPALFDNDGDGRVEIYIGGDSTAGGTEDWAGGVFRVLRWRGEVEEVWSRRTREVFTSSAAIGDIDGDGRMEAVVGGGTYYGSDDSRRVWAFHLDDGSFVPQWPRMAEGAVISSPVLGDVTGDDGGRPEVVVGSRDGRLWVWRGDGRLHIVDPPNQAGEGGGEIISTAALADLDGDGVDDITIGNGWAQFFVHGRTGRRLYEPIQKGLAHQSSAAVVQPTPGGPWVVVTVAREAGAGRGVAEAHALPVAPGKAPSWPEWRLGGRHLGAPPSGGPPFKALQQGYWFAAADGGVFAFGGAGFHGSLGNLRLTQPIVSMARTGRGGGYWLAAADGGVFAFGDAAFHGSAAGRAGAPIVEMTGAGNQGYWLAGADGSVHAFGSAGFYGSAAGTKLTSPMVTKLPTATARGYWLVAGDGGVFTYGDARFFGSTGAIPLQKPIVTALVTKSGNGYWLIAADGGVFAYGDARFHGSTGAITLNQPIVAAARTLSGNGYWLIAADGGVFAFGDAQFHGSTGDIRLNSPIVAAARSPLVPK